MNTSSNVNVYSCFKYIISCQSRFSRKSIDQIVTEPYQNTYSVAKNGLKDHVMSITDER